ncbi:variable surface lipoprotein, partial [Mycoplasmopsis bovis]|uniref:variable surface lipoprotein n=1 Tax=Mycoplasmopsis bovis TaxID=28903 RepID=UPI003D289318
MSGKNLGKVQVSKETEKKDKAKIVASIPFVAAKCGETKEEKKPEVDKPKLSETLKSITGNDLGKVQVAEQDKSNKEKIETAIKEAIVTKVPTLKDKELNLNADLSKKSVTVS